MNSSSLEYLRCPTCVGKLTAAPAALRCQSCQHLYHVEDEIPTLLASDHFPAPDSEAALEAETARYPLLMVAFALLARVWLPAERRRLIGQIGIRPGDIVLDHCTGPGGNLPAIASLTGQSGKLVAFDLSRAMVRAARHFARAKGIAADIQRADALQLPYADNCFDAVVHCGAINQLADKRRVIDEMLRVTKPGGAITILDEGIEPGKENTWLAKLLVWRNPLFASRPPLDLVPPSANPRIEWVLRSIFYQIIFHKPNV